MITETIKTQILDAIKADRSNYESDAKHAIVLGINKSVYNQLKKGTKDRLLKESEWIRLGRIMEVALNRASEWLTANTPTYQFIYHQLEWCQSESMTGIFCDKAGIGKTHTAKIYAKRNKNAVYIDCSEFKNKHRFIRAIARQFGVNHTGKITDVQQDLIYCLKFTENPIIILDEAGDLDYSAFLELKAMYNQLEGLCGFYMMGADGLKKKINRAINNDKVGYAEIFDRFGAKYQSITPTVPTEKTLFFRIQAENIIKANLPSADSATLIKQCDMSLRRIKHELIKLKKAA